jgi:hypothetical protein
MTWVVGNATFFGYAVGLSDIRVTFSDGTEMDCLQKLYGVGRFIAAGFAGSVAIGFGMMQVLSRLLGEAPQNTAWMPEAVAQWWPADARNVFGNFREEERRPGCQLMLLGAHPTENMGDAPWPRCSVYRFSAPTFEPQLAAIREVVSIGSGSDVPVYSDALRHLSESFDWLQGAIMGPQGLATALDIALTATLQDNPQPGISNHLHVVTVTRGSLLLGNNDHTSYLPDGSAREFKMPPAATSYEQLLELCRRHGRSTAEIIC